MRCNPRQPVSFNVQYNMTPGRSERRSIIFAVKAAVPAVTAEETIEHGALTVPDEQCRKDRIIRIMMSTHLHTLSSMPCECAINTLQLVVGETNSIQR